MYLRFALISSIGRVRGDGIYVTYIAGVNVLPTGELWPWIPLWYSKMVVVPLDSRSNHCPFGQYSHD